MKKTKMFIHILGILVSTAAAVITTLQSSGDVVLGAATGAAVNSTLTYWS